MKKTMKTLVTILLCGILMAVSAGCADAPGASAGYSGTVEGIQFELPDLGAKVEAGQGTPVELKWTVTSQQEITGYYVAVSRDPDMQELFCGEVTTQTSAVFSTLEPGTTYYWMVIASVPGGGISSEPAWFTTAE